MDLPEMFLCFHEAVLTACGIAANYSNAVAAFHRACGKSGFFGPAARSVRIRLQKNHVMRMNFRVLRRANRRPCMFWIRICVTGVCGANPAAFAARLCTGVARAVTGGP